MFRGRARQSLRLLETTGGVFCELKHRVGKYHKGIMYLEVNGDVCKCWSGAGVSRFSTNDSLVGWDNCKQDSDCAWMNDYSGWPDLVPADFDDFEETLRNVSRIDSASSKYISADEFQDTSRGLLSYRIKGPPFLRHVLRILESHAPGPLFQSIANFSMQLPSTCGQDIAVQNARHFVLDYSNFMLQPSLDELDSNDNLCISLHEYSKQSKELSEFQYTAGLSQEDGVCGGGDISGADWRVLVSHLLSRHVSVPSYPFYYHTCISTGQAYRCMPRLHLCCGWCSKEMKRLCQVSTALDALVVENCNQLDCTSALPCYPIDRAEEEVKKPKREDVPVAATPRPNLPPSPKGHIKMILQGTNARDFDQYMQASFIKVVSIGSDVAETLLTVAVTGGSRRRSLGTLEEQVAVKATPRPHTGVTSGPSLVNSRRLAKAPTSVDLQVTAFSVKRAMEAIKKIEQAIVTGRLPAALLSHGIPLDTVLLQQLELEAEQLGAKALYVNMTQSPYLLTCHRSCMTCISEDCDGCIICKDGYAFWQPPEAGGHYGQCVGNWDSTFMLMWAILPLVGMMLMCLCTWALFNTLDFTIDLGKRRHKKREVRWVPVKQEDASHDIAALSKAVAPPKTKK